MRRTPFLIAPFRIAMSLTDFSFSRGPTHADFMRLDAADVYPGKLDEQEVERQLAAFLQALGLRGRISRLRAARRREDDPTHDRGILRILAGRAKSRLGFRPFGAVLARRAARRFRALEAHARHRPGSAFERYYRARLTRAQFASDALAAVDSRG